MSIVSEPPIYMRPLAASKISTLETAIRLTELGYYVVPIKLGTKAPSVPAWQSLRLTVKEIPMVFSKPFGIGILLGVASVPDVFPVAIDVDDEDEDLITNILHVFPHFPPAKRGSKGITIFAYIKSPSKKITLRRGGANCVEILSLGQQTVIPPSPHPKGYDYEWINCSLTSAPPASLPELTGEMINEIELAVKKPESKIFSLNIMKYKGEGGGGSIDNSVFDAVNTYVAYLNKGKRIFSDDYIWARVDRESKRAATLFCGEYDWPGWEGKVRAKIKSALDAGFDKPSAKKTSAHILAAQWLLHSWQKEGRVYSNNISLMIYKNGHYKIMPDIRVRRALMNDYSIWTLDSQQAQKAVDIIIDCADEFPPIKCRKVCFTNGTYDIDRDTFSDWSPDDFLIAHRPFEYNPDAEAPLYENVVRRAFQHDGVGVDDVILNFEQFVSQTFFECLRFKKFLIIKGARDAGKSLLIQIIGSLHDDEEVSAVPVEQLGSERAGWAMQGKLVNITSEMEEAMTSHVADAFLKAVVSGDKISIRRLYGEMQPIVLPTRLIMACNDLFKTRDHSGAIQTRMKILRCNNIIPERDRDNNLLQKILPERPGIFNRMMNAWRILDKEGFRDLFYEDEDKGKLACDNNNVLQWFYERTKEGLGVEGERKWTETNQLYLDYSEWAKLCGNKPVSNNVFGSRLSEIQIEGKSISKDQKRIGGIPIRVRQLSLIHGKDY